MKPKNEPLLRLRLDRMALGFLPREPHALRAFIRMSKLPVRVSADNRHLLLNSEDMAALVAIGELTLSGAVSVTNLTATWQLIAAALGRGGRSGRVVLLTVSRKAVSAMFSEPRDAPAVVASLLAAGAVVVNLTDLHSRWEKLLRHVELHPIY